MSRVVTFGEIMIRLATPGYQRFMQAMPGKLGVSFAGAEASIASSIAYLGGDAAFVTALPSHALADACLADLRRLGVDTSGIVRTDKGRLGLYFLERGANQRPSQVVYDREGSAVAITPATDYNWSALLEPAEWFVVSGITPALSRTAAETTLQALREASRRGVRVACDMNYRQKLWRWDADLSPRALARRTMQQVLPYVDLFVGTSDDLQWLLGGENDSPVPQLARQFSAEYPRLQLLAMTRRQHGSATRTGLGGALYVTATDELWQSPSDGQLFPIDYVVDRIGSGDAFTAGLLFALTTVELASPETALRFAVAAACLSHTVEGDFNCNTRAEVESRMAGDLGGGVDR